MDSFSESAATLAGLAALMFGWRPGEFWEATPAELGSVIAAMRGDAGEGLGLEEVESLKRMFPDGPSTGFADPPPRSGEEQDGG